MRPHPKDIGGCPTSPQSYEELPENVKAFFGVDDFSQAFANGDIIKWDALCGSSNSPPSLVSVFPHCPTPLPLMIDHLVGRQLLGMLRQNGVQHVEDFLLLAEYTASTPLERVDKVWGKVQDALGKTHSQSHHWVGQLLQSFLMCKKFNEAMACTPRLAHLDKEWERAWIGKILEHFLPARHLAWDEKIQTLKKWSPFLDWSDGWVSGVVVGISPSTSKEWSLAEVEDLLRVGVNPHAIIGEKKLSVLEIFKKLRPAYQDSLQLWETASSRLNLAQNISSTSKRHSLKKM